MQILILPGIIFPICAGLLLFFIRPKRRSSLLSASASAVLVNSAVLASVIIYTVVSGMQDSGITVFDFGNGLSLAFRLDRASLIFTSIITVLWPFTTVFAFSYMKNKANENKLFSFFIMTFGIVAGIATARNLFTLYLFYELMTLVTLPLVMHYMNEKARSAGKKYLIYSMIGASMIFASFVFLYSYGITLDFIWGGVLDPSRTAGKENIMQAAFLLGFFGFGVKAALFPFHAWLPAAAVAPIPVTALLHAVAVVKSGAFSVMRLIFFCFGTEMLFGTPAQSIAMAAAAVTIVYGSSMALRTSHLKRRLAYSTIANLSYILLAFAGMTAGGFTGGIMHMIFHAVIKITLFFCSGAILHYAKKEYVDEMEGISSKMPITCAAFVITGLGLMGIPPLGGFISKLTIGIAVASTGTAAGIIGDAALIISASLTILYMMATIVRFYFPLRNTDPALIADVREADRCMTVPLIVLAVLSVVLAFCARSIIGFLEMQMI